MRETFSGGNNEDDDDSSNEDELLFSKKKKVTKIAKRLPLGLDTSVETTPTERRQRLTLSERFMQQIAEQQERHNAADSSRESDDDVEQALADDREDTEAETIIPDWEPEIITPDGRPINAPEAPASEVSDEITDAAELASLAENVSSETDDESSTPDDTERAEVAVADDVVEATAELTDDVVEVSDIEDADDLVPPAPSPVRIDMPSFGATSVAERPSYDSAAAERIRLANEANRAEAERLAEKRGLSRGVTSGLVAGYFLGRRNKKKAARVHSKEIKQKDIEIKDLKTAQSVAEQRLKTVQRTQEQMSRTVGSIETAKQTDKVLNKPEQVKLPKSVLKGETQTEIVNESVSFTPVAEKVQTRSKQPEKIIETAPEDRTIKEEDYAVEPGRRVETSAWHRMEIDEKTGKVIDNPEVAYGEEFIRERQQERIKRQSNDDTAAGLLGGIVAASASAQVSTVNDNVNPANDHAGKATESASNDDTKQDSSSTAAKEMLTYVSSPLVWVIAVLIVVALFAFGALR